MTIITDVSTRRKHKDGAIEGCRKQADDTSVVPNLCAWNTNETRINILKRDAKESKIFNRKYVKTQSVKTFA